MFKRIFKSLLLLSVYFGIITSAFASIDICDHLEIMFHNQLSDRYNIEISDISYEIGRSEGPISVGSDASRLQKLTDILHPSKTLWGLLHGRIHATYIINIIDKMAHRDESSEETDESINFNPIANQFTLDIRAQGHGKVRGLCVIETNLHVHKIPLNSNQMGLVTITKRGQDTFSPKVNVNIWQVK